MHYVVISDLHMHKWQYGSRLTEQGYNSRLWYLYKGLVQVKEFVEEHRPNALFICGDVFHTHDKLDVSVLFLTITALMEIAELVPIYILEGNHDMASASGQIHSLKVFEPFATVIDKPMKFEVAGRPIIAHPYTDDLNALTTFLASAEEGSVGLLHQGVAGANLGSSWVPDEMFGRHPLPSNIETIWSGHYHPPQVVGTHIVIPGSMAQLTWADAGEDGHGLWYVNEDMGRVDVELEMPKFVVGAWVEEFRDLHHEDSSGEVALVAGNFFRIVGCPEDVDVQQIRENMFACGCESVEVVYGEEAGVIAPRPGIIKTGDFSIEPLLEEYTKLQMSSRRAEIGKLIREFRYEVPKG
jgi:DNA repair exonuclease SbcCD nuclease subunit